MLLPPAQQSTKSILRCELLQQPASLIMAIRHIELVAPGPDHHECGFPEPRERLRLQDCDRDTKCLTSDISSLGAYLGRIEITCDKLPGSHGKLVASFDRFVASQDRLTAVCESMAVYFDRPKYKGKPSPIE